MGEPVVLFEVVGRDPARLRRASRVTPGSTSGVPDVGAALERAEDLGGSRAICPVASPCGLVIGHFTDPEGTLIGVAGTRERRPTDPRFWRTAGSHGDKTVSHCGVRLRRRRVWRRGAAFCQRRGAPTSPPVTAPRLPKIVRTLTSAGIEPEGPASHNEWTNSAVRNGARTPDPLSSSARPDDQDTPIHARHLPRFLARVGLAVARRWEVHCSVFTLRNETGSRFVPRLPELVELAVEPCPDLCLSEHAHRCGMCPRGVASETRASSVRPFRSQVRNAGTRFRGTWDCALGPDDSTARGSGWVT
jgi:hypothetical protein